VILKILRIQSKNKDLFEKSNITLLLNFNNSGYFFKACSICEALSQLELQVNDISNT